MTDRALESVLQQSRPVDEVIVVDDFSNEPYIAPKDSCVRVIRHEKNQGVSAARNTGIEASKHEWLCFLDSDDEWHANKIKEQVKDSVQNPNLSVFYTDELWQRNDNVIKKQKHQLKKTGWIFEDSLNHCLIGASTLLIKKSVFDQVGLFDESLKVCEDYDLWIRITHKFEVYLNSLELITKYAGHEDQLSIKFFAMDYYRLKSLIKFKMAEKKLSEEISSKVDSLIKHKFMLLKKGALKHGNDELLKKLDEINSSEALNT